MQFHVWLVKERHNDLISPLIIRAIRRKPRLYMQGLMDVPDKMNQKFHCIAALGKRFRAISHVYAKARNGMNDAISLFWLAIARRIIGGLIEWNVNKVPAGAIWMAGTVIFPPVCDRRHLDAAHQQSDFSYCFQLQTSL